MLSVVIVAIRTYRLPASHRRPEAALQNAVAYIYQVGSANQRRNLLRPHAAGARTQESSRGRILRHAWHCGLMLKANVIY